MANVRTADGGGGNRGDGRGRWWRGGGGGDGSGDDGRYYKRKFFISAETYVWALILFNIAMFATALANSLRRLCADVVARVQTKLIAYELRGANAALSVAAAASRRGGTGAA